MPYFCCFCCPSEDYKERTLDETCPTCGRKYRFPLDKFPSEIGLYKGLEPLGRGFYAATYRAKWGNLRKDRVLKISPKKIYVFFKKDFAKECDLHNKVAEGTDHVVEIEESFEEDISFGDVSLTCNIAVLRFVDGEPLKQIIEEKKKMPARRIAQIAIDLYRILEELQSRRIFHNDLHGGNIIIEKLGENHRRMNALDESIRVVAVDLGSLSEESKSDSSEGRLSDLHQVAKHLRILTNELLRDPDKIEDQDYRIANLLDTQSFLLAPPVQSQRQPEPGELISNIELAYHQIRSPWSETLTLKRFHNAYNAQTLEPWFVPHLLVDPDKQWVRQMSTHGPQIITGMRGCGKTMLLRALQLHARATKLQNEEERDVKQRLTSDGFVGLYVSCTRLLDTLGTSKNDVQRPFERLFIAYAKEAIQAIRHIKEIDHECVSPLYHKVIAEALNDCLDSEEDWLSISSEIQLERRISSILVSMRKGDGGCLFKTRHPSHAFEQLAEAIKKTTTYWHNAYVLYLLDDVSTRYLSENLIETIISSLLFQSLLCAFKLTTEAQTLALALHSPGQIEQVRVGRDYDFFDLGAEVYAMTGGKSKSKAKKFLGRILEQRARYFAGHPKNASPIKILNDTSLESVARKIVGTSENSRERKEIYHGISVLAGVCVGDIGDVISIYELILRKSIGERFPIKKELQSESYQDFCSHRLYDLNRRKSDLKDFALSFAQASHELLVQSYEQIMRGENKRKRLRQYTQIYVRVTTGNTEWQFERLRELIDAGIFVLKGGSQTPRTKTRDADPIQQFVLTYRKLFGLSSFIGLGERDRFELSGDQLQNWLKNPDKGKEILLANLGKPQIDEDEEEIEEVSEDIMEPISESKGKQLILFETDQVVGELSTEREDVEEENVYSNNLRASVKELDKDELKQKEIDTVVIGLGFEERTAESAKRILHLVKPGKVRLIKYKTAGKEAEIVKSIRKASIKHDFTEYSTLISEGFENLEGNVLVDITGLAKPAIFHSIRSALKINKKVLICHTHATQYYPLNEKIAEILEPEEQREQYILMEELKKILTGEKGPYEIVPLLKSDADESRRRVLFAFSSPKHGRLLALLDKREYDQIEIAVSNRDNPRSKLAQIIAKIAESSFNAKVDRIDPDDLAGILELLIRRYRLWYINRGFNFECGLTDSKIEAVCCAIASSMYKFSQCWYVRPKEFDPARFSVGVGRSEYFEVLI